MYNIIVANETNEHLWASSVTELLTYTSSDYRDFSLFFDWRWRKILQKTFGHTPYYLLAENKDKQIEAACPLFHVTSRLFGSSLISLPYLNGGGIISKSLSATNALIQEIDNLHNKLGCEYAELRARNALVTTSETPVRTHKVAMVLPLLDDPERMFSLFPPKLRSQIRRPTKEGCHAQIIPGNRITQNDIQKFYSVFSTHMRDLGTPVFPKKLFSETLKSFGKDSHLCIVQQNNEAIAAGIIIQSGTYVEIPWAASLKSKRKFAPNMLLYWEILKTACTCGATHFDFGRSTAHSGTYKFKEQWGALPHQLHWYYPIENSNIPDINPDSKKFELLVSTWKKLPLVVANLIGPYITKSLP